MKKLLVCLLLQASLLMKAQTIKYPAVDKSPLDISYCPDSYPLLKLQEKTNEPLIARVIYSRPQKNGRVIFGELIPYNKIWRLGANEASEIEFYHPVVINKIKVKKGKYTLYAIPSANKWTLVLNKETDTWGAFKYDEKKDVLRLEVPVEKTTEPVDNFSMLFSKLNGVYALIIAWDEMQVSLPFSL